MPSATPKDVVQKMHDVVQKALDSPEVKAKLAKLGVEPANMSVEEFGKFFKQDFEATRQLAKDAGMHALD